jgi:hypothetical protein
MHMRWAPAINRSVKYVTFNATTDINIIIINPYVVNGGNFLKMKDGVYKKKRNWEVEKPIVTIAS